MKMKVKNDYQRKQRNSFENQSKQKRERKNVKKKTKENENQNNQLKNLKEFAFEILFVCVVLNNTFEVISFQ